MESPIPHTIKSQYLPKRWRFLSSFHCQCLYSGWLWLCFWDKTSCYNPSWLLTHCVVHTGLTPQQPTCFCLPRAGITDMCHHTQLSRSLDLTLVSVDYHLSTSRREYAQPIGLSLLIDLFQLFVIKDKSTKINYATVWSCEDILYQLLDPYPSHFSMSLHTVLSHCSLPNFLIRGS